jgi:hypothetical protein
VKQKLRKSKKENHFKNVGEVSREIDVSAPICRHVNAVSFRGKCSRRHGADAQHLG